MGLVGAARPFGTCVKELDVSQLFAACISEHFEYLVSMFGLPILCGPVVDRLFKLA